MNVRPDRPNSPRHDALRASWREGQIWETRLEDSDVWVRVAVPLWDEYQEYRMVENSSKT